MTDPATTSQPWTALQAYPPPLPVDAGYDRHDPDPTTIRCLIENWMGDRDWVGAGWGELIDGLLAAGRADAPAARLFEGHVDALRILAQAGADSHPRAWYGVWASRSQRTGVAVRRGGHDTFVLNGQLRFASGAGALDRALVPVWDDAGHHHLLDLDVADLPVDTEQWATSAMAASRSHTVALDDHPVDGGTVVGPVDFYLNRPAFLPGGVGVAACWAGAAARVADLLDGRLRSPLPDTMAAQLGRLRVSLAGMIAALTHAAARLDVWAAGAMDPAESGSGIDAPGLSTETRAVVAHGVDDVLRRARRLAGPAGLAFDRDLTCAVDDLQLYVLQHNRDADTLALGRR